MLLILANLLKKTDNDNKITEIEEKIPSITSLATTAALNAVKNETCNVSDLVKKAEYNGKILDIEKNISLFLIIINLQVKYLMQR